MNAGGAAAAATILKPKDDKPTNMKSIQFKQTLFQMD